MNILKPKVSHLIKWKRAINTWWNELPCSKHSFTSDCLFWEIHFYQTQRPNFYLRFISFPSVLIQATFTLRPIYVPSSQEMHRKWDGWVRDRRNRKRGRKNCDRAEEKSLMCESIFHNQGSALWFKSEETAEERRKEQRVWVLSSKQRKHLRTPPRSEM